MKINLLDHGYIELISHMGDDDKVVEDARKSIAGEGVRPNKGPKSRLIDYLMRNWHTGPFEGSTVSFDVQAPIFVARQWMRHRTQSYNEMSARYGELPKLYYTPKEWRSQAAKNKQCSDNPFINDGITYMYQVSNESSWEAYQTLLSEGVAREMARMILPVSWYTKFHTTANLWNFMHFMKLRNHEHAQYEIKVYADAMESMLSGLFPLSMEAWRKHVK